MSFVAVHFDKRKEPEMRVTRNPGILLLALWLILTGLLFFVPALSQLSVLLAILAILAGILLLVGR